MSSEDLLIAQHKGKSVLLDSNLLLLMLVGTFQRTRVESFKRTAHFSLLEFDLLLALLTNFRSIVTTPHILTEVSNLSNSLSEHLKASWWEHFATLAGSFLEVYEPAANIIKESTFNPFGLTDAAIQHAAGRSLVVTEDYRLSGVLQALGLNVLNFRHIMHSAGYP